MSKQKWIIVVVAGVLMAGTAGLLTWLRAHQRLGAPGIQAIAIPGSLVMDIDLPERVLDFKSERVPENETVTNTLPKDTSFAQRLYKAPDGFWVNANIILMGMDRTSIHKPDYCLSGQGFNAYERTNVDISIDGPVKYDLPVAKWTFSTQVTLADGTKTEAHGVYVFWFVADGEQTPSYTRRLWWIARDLLHTGVLQRWAYVNYFAMCLPGQEDAAFERMKKLIAASVPEFQMPPKPADVAVANTK